MTRSQQLCAQQHFCRSAPVCLYVFGQRDVVHVMCVHIQEFIGLGAAHERSMA